MKRIPNTAQPLVHKGRPRLTMPAMGGSHYMSDEYVKARVIFDTPGFPLEMFSGEMSPIEWKRVELCLRRGGNISMESIQ